MAIADVDPPKPYQPDVRASAGIDPRGEDAQDVYDTGRTFVALGSDKRLLKFANQVEDLRRTLRTRNVLLTLPDGKASLAYFKNAVGPQVTAAETALVEIERKA